MRISVITSNPGKVAEYQREFDHLGIEMIHLRVNYDEVQSFDLEEVVAKGMKEIKSRGIEDFIIDDSGLFVDSLSGFPGVWSAYVQKTIGNKGILKLMAGESDRNARFKCCIGCNINGEDIVVTGICEGSILHEEKGSGGFGFDPIFTHDGERSFAEIPIEEKNEVSHRGNAVRLLMERLENKVPGNKS